MSRAHNLQRDMFQKTNCHMEVPLGNVGSATPDWKFGRNPDVDIAANEDVWDGGGNYVFQNSAVRLVAFSTNDGDQVNSSGAQNILVSGLGANYVSQVETVAMDGTTATTLSNLFLRVNRAEVLTDNGSGPNLGNIDVSVADSGDLQARITAEKGKTLMAVYTVEASKTLLMTQWYGLVGRNNDAHIELFQRSEGGSWQVEGDVQTFQNPVYKNFIPYKPFLSRMDIRIHVDAATQNNTEVAAGFDFYLIG